MRWFGMFLWMGMVGVSADLYAQNFATIVHLSHNGTVLSETVPTGGVINDIGGASTGNPILFNASFNESLSVLSLGEAPSIGGIELDRRSIVAGDWVSSQPEISTVISDGDGDISTWSVEVRSVPHHSVVLSKTVTVNAGASVPVSFVPDSGLNAGEYVVRVVAMDGMGNVTSKNSDVFVVGDRLSIKDFMVGPNPVNLNQSPIYIQYQLPVPASVDIYVYAISGEKLWSKSVSSFSAEGGQAGFNSITWDGRSQFGAQLANGPYIIYAIASADGRTVKAKAKLLVLK